MVSNRKFKNGYERIADHHSTICKNKKSNLV